ncbi:hypothetical protein HPB48_001346 [Haemaphysalis longicornis]|uniref:Uncharacterized protein n=1 Tax=Haemaphysalis longicornis TaxID=44386 RepID=A0A9J6FGN4_HAELO|nr:hypothetical protein HPB48_001346 [Haemaphysalis longicornis]
MEVAQTVILAELKVIRDAKNNLEGIMNRVSSRIDALEKSDDANQSYVDGSVPSSSSCLNKLTSELQTLAVKCDDAENRLRRSNPVFFGIADKKGET